MYGICIESSHKRGMGHLYRALNVIRYLKKMEEPYIVIINEDDVSINILDSYEIPYITVDYQDVKSNWEGKIIQNYHIDVWLLDKFETGTALCKHVKEQDIILAAIDDCGRGANYVDLHFCSMLFKKMKGKKIYFGKEYLILNPDIEKYRRKRTRLDRIVISLGGSDTYGVTVSVVNILKKIGYTADIVVGPGFQHMDQLKEAADSKFEIYQNVPSLVGTFHEYDLAITGGGVTCFEANASGLPCFVIANELHEIDTGRYIEKFGGAVFIGHYKELNEKSFPMNEISVEDMSRAALRSFRLNGVENMMKKIRHYQWEEYINE